MISSEPKPKPLSPTVADRQDNSLALPCHDCGEIRPLREYEYDAPSSRGEWDEAVQILICEECYEEQITAAEEMKRRAG